MKKEAAEITLRPFERSDFKRLISWVPTPEAHGQWRGPFFSYPLDESRLQRYLDTASQPNTRAIFTALLPSGEPVGHVEISNIWSYLSTWALVPVWSLVRSRFRSIHTTSIASISVSILTIW
jgi:RimJ/RimL family protein N-acetyltransferase